MPHKIAPPCGYIRDVCYNDCVPELKYHPPRRKKTDTAVIVAESAPAPTETLSKPPREASDNSLLLKLILAYYLS